MEIVNHMPELEAQELDARLSRIRLPVKSLAERVGCDQSTIASYARGQRRMNGRLLRDVTSQLVREELSLLAHLAALHPQAAIESGRAASSQPPRAA